MGTHQASRKKVSQYWRIKRSARLLRSKGWATGESAEDFNRRVRRFTKSHWGCNCWMCCNPRRLRKNTQSVQEKKQRMKYDSEQD